MRLKSLSIKNRKKISLWGRVDLKPEIFLVQIECMVWPGLKICLKLIMQSDTPGSLLWQPLWESSSIAWGFLLYTLVSPTLG